LLVSGREVHRHCIGLWRIPIILLLNTCINAASFGIVTFCLRAIWESTKGLLRVRVPEQAFCSRPISQRSRIIYTTLLIPLPWTTPAANNCN
jgi:hypothetical protein